MRAGAALLVMAILGCAGARPPALTPEGARTRALRASDDAATAKQVRASCREVGAVAFRNRVTDADPKRAAAAEAAVDQLRNELGRKGATHAIYELEERGAGAAWMNRYVFVDARGFDCAGASIPEPAPPAPPSRPEAAPGGEPAPGGCGRDIDCKGDRICVDRVCVDPPKR